MDGTDAIPFFGNIFTATGSWSLGDFTADGATDGADAILLFDNIFMSSDGTAVPEPVTSIWWLMILGLLGVRRR